MDKGFRNVVVVSHTKPHAVGKPQNQEMSPQGFAWDWTRASAVKGLSYGVARSSACAELKHLGVQPGMKQKSVAALSMCQDKWFDLMTYTEAEDVIVNMGRCEARFLLS
jgi:hypothetical protein